MTELFKEIEITNQQIIKDILHQKGWIFLMDVLAVAKEAEVKDKFEIVRTTTGHYQKEYGYNSFDGYWVDQWSIGDSGDSFNGYIYIQLQGSTWLKMFYSC